MGVDGFCFDCILSHCAAASSAVGGGGAQVWRRGGGRSGESFFGSGGTAIALRLLAGSGGMLRLQCVRMRRPCLGGMWTRDMAPRQGSNQRRSARSTTVQVTGGTTHQKKRKNKKEQA